MSEKQQQLVLERKGSVSWAVVAVCMCITSHLQWEHPSHLQWECASWKFKPSHPHIVRNVEAAYQQQTPSRALRCLEKEQLKVAEMEGVILAKKYIQVGFWTEDST